MSSLAKASYQLVIDLMNADNGTTFDYTSLVLSPPVPNDISNYNRNTSIVVSSSDEFQFDGVQTMYYNRLDFAAVFDGLQITLGGQGITDISGFLPELNATYGLGLTMDDLVDQLVPSNPTYPLTMTLVANANSYAYTGQFTVTIQNIPATLNDNLSTNVLGNIGDDGTNLWTAINDINMMAMAVIQMNLDRYKQSNFLRALAQDVQQGALVGIRQALEIGGVDDTTRSLRADLTALQTLVGTLPTSGALNTIDSTLTSLQSQITAVSTLLGTDAGSFQTQITANATALAALSTATTAALAGKMAAPSIQSVTITTPSGSQLVGVVSVAKLAILLKVTTDVPARIRLYPNVTERNNDLGRASTTPAPAGIGQLFEGITTADLLTFYTGPTPFLYNGDPTPDDNIAYTIEPAVDGVVNVTLTYYGLLQ